MKIAEDSPESSGCLPAGEVGFIVVDAKDATSKKTGAEMIALELKLLGANGASGTAKDWLVELPSVRYRIKKFCEATGMMREYASKDVPSASCIGKSGRCIITFEQSEQYGPQNRVKDYIAANGQATAPAATPPKEDAGPTPPGDDIPFDPSPR